MEIELARLLASRQLSSGGWGFTASQQAATEATCLALLALSGGTKATAMAIEFLAKSQLYNGGWASFQGDTEASWATALALSTAIITNSLSAGGERALRWLLAERGKEGHWFWRWKFKIADRNVRFDPDKYGWPWSPGTCSWVVPTAFSVIATKQFTTCSRTRLSENRIRLGVEMLLDRVCADGGWNAGNSVVYGVPLGPHVEATAIALLALQDEPRGEVIEHSLQWLRRQAPTVESASSLAWCILSLFVYQEPIQELKNRLATMVKDGAEVRNNATLATALLALRCGEMIHPFMVLR
jgi:squalene cyclase